MGQSREVGVEKCFLLPLQDEYLKKTTISNIEFIGFVELRWSEELWKGFGFIWLTNWIIVHKYHLLKSTLSSQHYSYKHYYIYLSYKIPDGQFSKLFLEYFENSHPSVDRCLGASVGWDCAGRVADTKEDDGQSWSVVEVIDHLHHGSVPRTLCSRSRVKMYRFYVTQSLYR